MTKLENLFFCCENCDWMHRFEDLEVIINDTCKHFKRLFECPNCGEVSFQVYSDTKY